MAIKTKVSRQVHTNAYALYCGDCCEVLPTLPAESVGLSVFSPPFCSLYAYSDDHRDMGNSKSYQEFFTHFGFLVKELKRLLMPGRIVAVHCMDLPTFKSSGDEIGHRDFPGDIIRCFEEQGFVYHCRFVIWKDPLVAATRTKALGLAHKQICKDSTMCRTGMADYIVAFRKPGENPRPVRNVNGLSVYHGARIIPHNLDRFLKINPVTGEPWDPKENKRSHWIWQKYASPVWDDIRQTRVLPFTRARDKDDQRHICLAKNSRVLTKERGYIPIQQVQVGEYTLTHKGRWRKVLAVQNIGVQDTITVRGQGVPGLRLTPDHKLWARKSDWVRQRDGAECTTPRWIEAKDCLGGYLNLKLPEENPPAITELLHWWVVGRWLADGHWGGRGDVHISCGYHEFESLKSKLGNLAGFVHDSGTSYQIRIRDGDGQIRETLSRCGVGASNKHLPPEAFTLPTEQAEALVDGYLSGDGHFLEGRQSWMATSVSRDLLLGLALVIQRVYGSIASIYAGRPARIARAFNRLLHCRQEWTLRFDLVNESRYKQQFIVDDGAWKRVRSIKDSGKCEVWNIRVDEDESFTAEGCIVKNCPLQTDVIERCVALWSRKGDVVLTPFMGVGSEVFVAVRNGRKGVGVELKPSYFKQAMLNLKSLERRESRKLVKV